VADVAMLRRLALALPAAEEGTSYGTPCWRVRRTFFARLREDGESVVVKVDPGEGEILLAAEPEVFFVTPHYHGYPLVLVRLAAIEEDELAEVLAESWRRAAPAKLLRAYDEAHPPPGDA
jgi:hypothetical protein